jgi:hypothetical protein
VRTETREEQLMADSTVEPGGLVPPYEGRTSGAETPADNARRESVERMLSETKDANAGVTESPADEQPARDDEVTSDAPKSAAGVGESSSRRGEDIVDEDGKEAGRRDSGTKSASERPVGVSDARDSTGVDPQASQEG